MPVPAVLDTNVIVGLLDAQDLWSTPALKLRAALQAQHFEPVIFDCVLAEVVSIIARRVREKRRVAQLADLLAQLQAQFPSRSIVWLSPDLPKLYDKVVVLVKRSDGELDFNDALIALSCQLRGLELIASFDAAFDHHTPWLKRIARPDQLADTASDQ